MRIALSGATGFIGSALVERLKKAGHEIIPIVRRKTTRDELAIGCTLDDIETEKLTNMDSVIHLAGENIFGFWNKKKKRKIYDSRVIVTRLLSEALVSCKTKPQSFLCASAVGIYGNRPNDDMLYEKSTLGQGFLAEVCKNWETATEPAIRCGIRVINMRFGIVFDPTGGALKKMVTLSSPGIIPIIGSGKQYVSWVSLTDVIRAIEYLLTSNIFGAVNIVAPQPVTNKELTETLASILHRKIIGRIPAFLLTLLIGEMAHEILLSNQKVYPEVLNKSGFKFLHPNLHETFSKFFK